MKVKVVWQAGNLGRLGVEGFRILRRGGAGRRFFVYQVIVC